MKAMWFAFLACALVAVAADIGLDYVGFSAQDQQSSPAVRLD